MKRRLFLLTLLTCAALSCAARASAQATEPAGAATDNNMTRQNADAPQQHVIASPNPTIDDGETTDDVGPAKVEAVKIRPARGATAAPLKTAEPKPKRRRAGPQTD
jgi:hypothetical protein